MIKENDLEILNSYFQDILYRDIISRYRLTQVNEIKQIGLYFASNIGKLFSYSTLQSLTGLKSLSSIKNYLLYFEQSYLFFYLKKFDYSVKKQIMNPKKVYTIDPAFVHRLGFNFTENKGRILENIVFLELLRRGKEVYFHKGKYECDFLVKEGLDIVEAIQVVFQLDASNWEREYRGLLEAFKSYHTTSGLLLTISIDKEFIHGNEEVKIMTVWEWLLS